MHNGVVVITFALVKLLDLILDVTRVLAGQTGQLRRTEALRPVAVGTTGQAGELVTTVINELADSQQFSILGSAATKLLVLEKDADRLHLCRRQFFRLRLHGVALALAGLEIGQLAGDIIGMLPRQTREDRTGRLALQSVAEEAATGNDFFSSGQIHLLGGHQAADAKRRDDGTGQDFLHRTHLSSPTQKQIIKS